MLYCKGKGCQYSQQCSRFVLGKGAVNVKDLSATWMDHCIAAKKFIKVGA